MQNNMALRLSYEYLRMATIGTEFPFIDKDYTEGIMTIAKISDKKEDENGITTVSIKLPKGFKKDEFSIVLI